jgi:hypothetical protein
MAERKSGPVKPPVIDLKARDASQPAEGAATKSASTKPATQKPKPEPAPVPTAETTAPEAAPTEAPAPETTPTEAPVAEPKPEPVRPMPTPPIPPAPPVRQAKLAMPWSAISIAAIGGALLGTALTYSLVNLVPMPSNAPVIADPTERLAELSDRLGALEGRIPALEAGSTATNAALDGAARQAAETGAGLSALETRLAEVQASIPAASEVDLGPITTQLDTLESRVTAIAAGASSADAAALANSLNTIEATVAELAARLDAADDRLSQIDSIAAELDTAKAAIAAQNQTLGGANIGPAVKLPLVVSGLETAFSAGRPYVDELESLRALLPDLAVPAAVSAAAETGLTRADALASTFNAAVPTILAARAAQSTGDWGKDAIEWAKGLLALRPTGEMQGNTPDAIVSRLEAAVERHDFTAAATLFGQLPEPMQSVAADIATDIRAHATADSFLAGLRAQALAPAAEATP